MPKKQEGLEELFVEEIQDLLDAEKQLVRALPKMSKAAADEELANALREHLEATRGHVDRLSRVFETLDKKPRSRACKGMQGIVEEGEEVVQREHGQPVLDAAIAGSARKVEHYEIAGYESVCGLAAQLGMRDAENLLRQTLEEEVEADRLLARLAKRLASQAPAASEVA